MYLIEDLSDVLNELKPSSNDQASTLHTDTQIGVIAEMDDGWIIRTIHKEIGVEYKTENLFKRPQTSQLY